MKTVFVEPEDVWDEVEDNRETLETTMQLIASDSSQGIEVYITVDDDAERSPLVIVTQDSEEIYSEYCVNQKDCERTVNKVYEDFLDDTGDEEETESFEEKRDERETELDSAVVDFLCTVDENSCFDFSDEEIEEIKDHFLEFLARNYDVEIYRPMVLVTATGEEFTSEYPYKQMIFDD